MHHKAAFSLVELVVVVVIIGIVSAIGVPRLSDAKTKALVARAEANVRVMRDALDMFDAEHPGVIAAFADTADPYEQEGPAAPIAELLSPSEPGNDPYSILTAKTDKSGALAPNGSGPYMAQIPTNPLINDVSREFYADHQGYGLGLGGSDGVAWAVAYDSVSETALIGYWKPIDALKAVAIFPDE